MNNAFNLIKNKIYIPVLLLFITFFFYYFPTLKSLVKVWSTDDDYSYGYLIPLITSYLIWEKRKEIKETATSVNWLAVVPFLLFLVISLYGMLCSSPSAVRPTIPLILLSIVLFCFGRKMFKVLFFPLAFLIFMIPLSTLVQNKIGVPLKAISTKLGAVFLRLSGISVFVEGNVIDLGVTQLQVVDACAGLRFILPLFALGVIFAHFFEKKQVETDCLSCNYYSYCNYYEWDKNRSYRHSCASIWPESCRRIFSWIFRLDCFCVCFCVTICLPFFCSQTF